MSFYILLTLLFSLVATTLILHYGMSLLDFLPEQDGGSSIKNRQHFQLNYTFYLNLLFLALSGLMYYFKRNWMTEHGHHEMADKGKTVEKILRVIAIISYVWLAGGLIIYFFVS